MLFNSSPEIEGLLNGIFNRGRMLACRSNACHAVIDLPRPESRSSMFALSSPSGYGVDDLMAVPTEETLSLFVTPLRHSEALVNQGCS